MSNFFIVPAIALHVFLGTFITMSLISGLSRDMFKSTDNFKKYYGGFWRNMGDKGFIFFVILMSLIYGLLIFMLGLILLNIALDIGFNFIWPVLGTILAGTVIYFFWRWLK